MTSKFDGNIDYFFIFQKALNSRNLTEWSFHKINPKLVSIGLPQSNFFIYFLLAYSWSVGLKYRTQRHHLMYWGYHSQISNSMGHNRLIVLFDKFNEAYLFGDISSSISEIVLSFCKKQTRWIREAIWIQKRGEPCHQPRWWNIIHSIMCMISCWNIGNTRQSNLATPPRVVLVFHCKT